MIYVLVFIFSTNAVFNENSLVKYHIEFNSEQACKSALDIINREFNNHYKLSKCIPKG